MANSNTHKDNLPLNDEWISRLWENQLSKEEKDLLSANTDDNTLLADALEGLEQYASIGDAKKQAHDLNQQLLEQLKTKQTKKIHQPMPLSTVVWIALVFILVMVLLGYYLIKVKGL
ncbi:MAG: hypothetical protein QM610_03815 [Chitinophagaceae bacterium]